MQIASLIQKDVIEMAGKIFRQIDGRKKDTDNIPPKAENPYGHRKRKPSINSGPYYV